MSTMSLLWRWTRWRGRLEARGFFLGQNFLRKVQGNENVSSGGAKTFETMSDSRTNNPSRVCGGVLLGQGAKLLSGSARAAYPRHHGSRRCKAAGTAGR